MTILNIIRKTNFIKNAGKNAVSQIEVIFYLKLDINLFYYLI